MRVAGMKEVVSTVSLLTRAVISRENCRPQVREGQAEKKSRRRRVKQVRNERSSGQATPTDSMSSCCSSLLLPLVMFLHKPASILNGGTVHVPGGSTVLEQVEHGGGLTEMGMKPSVV